MRSYSDDAALQARVAPPAPAPVDVPPMPLDRVLASISMDAASLPTRYLAETEVPEGGE